MEVPCVGIFVLVSEKLGKVIFILLMGLRWIPMAILWQQWPGSTSKGERALSLRLTAIMRTCRHSVDMMHNKAVGTSSKGMASLSVQILFKIRLYEESLNMKNNHKVKRHLT